MSCIWQNLQVHLVVLFGDPNILCDICSGHALIVAAYQVPLRHLQGQQGMWRGMLIPLRHGLGEAAD